MLRPIRAGGTRARESLVSRSDPTTASHATRHSTRRAPAAPARCPFRVNSALRPDIRQFRRWMTRRRPELLGGASTAPVRVQDGCLERLSGRRPLTPGFRTEPYSPRDRTHDLLRCLRKGSTVRTIQNALQTAAFFESNVRLRFAAGPISVRREADAQADGAHEKTCKRRARVLRSRERATLLATVTPTASRPGSGRDASRPPTGRVLNLQCALRSSAGAARLREGSAV